MFKFTTITGFLFLFCFGAFAQNKMTSQPSSQQLTRILFLFDASQSMFGRWESDNKFEIAKKLLSNIVDSLHKINNVEMALRVYGHTKKFPPQDCDDTQLEIPFGKANGFRIKDKLNAITPSGTTPIAQSLEQCGKDFPEGQSRNIIILITDGIEECNGDPCAVSFALQKKGIFLKPFIIGLNMSNDLQKQFECVGTFYDAATENSFVTIMNVVISQALNNTTLQVNLLDQKGNPTETNVNMTFYDTFSGAIRYNFMHTMNSKGLPDTLVVDPLSKYKIVVHTVPPVTIDTVASTPGKHTVVGVNAAQGDLFLKFEGLNDYRNLKCIVRKAGDLNTLVIQDFNSSFRYLIGKYDLEILTLPRLYIENVDISQSKTTTVQIPNPGIASIMSSGTGYGSVYVEEGNILKWIYNLNSEMSRESLVMLPGKYRVIYRAKNARESKYTVEKTFRITSGSSQTINLN
ncbi:MAG: VWA domain-containing protein [Bacteroidota bacterium]|nr:VWA domain-containing protein [Bacteroidota bacterium]